MLSRSTGGVDWGYLNSGLSYLPRLNAANVSASHVSSTITQVSGTSLACTTALKGSIRYSNTSNTLEYCNSTAWVSAGPSTTVVPSFYAYRATSDQALSAATYTKIQFNAETVDTNNNFDPTTNYRFTPTIPGKYLLTAQVLYVSLGSTDTFAVQIRKNGVLLNVAQNQAPAASQTSQITSIVDANGTTDYFEIYGYRGGAGNVSFGSNITTFQGILISMAGGSGGDATPAGISGSIQFNSAGALAGRSDIIVDPSGSVGIGTGAPRAALDVSGTVKMAGTGAEACVSNTLGTFRFNPVTGVPQICR